MESSNAPTIADEDALFLRIRMADGLRASLAGTVRLYGGAVGVRHSARITSPAGPDSAAKCVVSTFSLLLTRS